MLKCVDNQVYSYVTGFDKSCFHTVAVYPYRSACGIGYASEKIREGVQLAIHSTVGAQKDHE